MGADCSVRIPKHVVVEVVESPSPAAAEPVVVEVVESPSHAAAEPVFVEVVEVVGSSIPPSVAGADESGTGTSDGGGGGAGGERQPCNTDSCRSAALSGDTREPFELSLVLDVGPAAPNQITA